MKLSIIICTFNRAYAIAPCLDSIAAAVAHAGAQAEIVVVDNASTDSTSLTVKDWAKSCPLPVNLVYEPKKGLASARNCGLRAATGELIMFTDDDCRMSKNYVNDLLAYFNLDTELVIRGGRVELGDSADLPLTIKTDSNRIRWDKKSRAAEYELIGGKTISGCNMAMKREVVQRLGKFDERLGAGTNIPGGEDTDYYLRAYLAGIAIEYVPDMTIFHWHGRKLPADANKLMKNYTVSNGALYAKYLFKAPYLCKELLWDLRKSVHEIIHRQNNFLPDWNFSYRDKFRYCLSGIMKYYYAVMIAK